MKTLFAQYPELFELREQAKLVRDPTTEDDTLDVILSIVREKKPRRILEIGSAEGLTTCSMLLSSTATATALELERERVERAKENFRKFGLTERVELLEGDAMDILPTINGEFDLVFLDGPKVQYRKYLPFILERLAKGGVLLSDDVLLYGWVQGKTEVPKKRRMLVEHIREYLQMLEDESSLQTTLLEVGEGLAVSVKK